MEINEKINIISVRIDNLNIHIAVLEEDIYKNPNSDIEGKPSRLTVLEDFKAQKNALILEREALTNQG